MLQQTYNVKSGLRKIFFYKTLNQRCSDDCIFNLNTEQSSPWQADGRSDAFDIPRLLCNPQVHCPVHKTRSSPHPASSFVKMYLGHGDSNCGTAFQKAPSLQVLRLQLSIHSTHAPGVLRALHITNSRSFITLTISDHKYKSKPPHHATFSHLTVTSSLSCLNTVFGTFQ